MRDGTASLAALDRDHDGFDAGPKRLILVGPPGTGKTRAVLDVWLAPAMRCCRPEQVLACSFTKAAAGEMRERLVKATDKAEWELMRVCKTIHSEALRLVRLAFPDAVVWKGKEATKPKPKEQLAKGPPQHALRFDDPKPEEPEADPAGWAALEHPVNDLEKEALRVYHLARNRYPGRLGRPLEKLLASCAQDSPFLVSDLAVMVRSYEADKAAVGAVDFTDMLTRCLEIEPPRRRLVVVDEAQDLSPLQAAVVERWASAADQSVLVGDPDQGIFGFAGADGHRLTEMIRAGHEVRSLQQSWRVPEGAHRIARRVILRNRNRVDAPYLPSSTHGAVQFTRDKPGSALYAANRADKGLGVFVLARTKAALGAYAEELSQLGVPFIHEKGASPLKQTTMVRLVLAVWRLVEGRTLSRAEALQLAKAMPGRKRGLYFTGPKNAAELSLRCVEDGDRLSRVELEGHGLRLGWVPVGGGDGSVVTALDAIGWKEKAGPLLRIAERSGDFAALDHRPAITLTTIHASKGREADAVVVDLKTAGIIARKVRMSTDVAEEERRVLYVGITRTKQELLFVRPDRNDFAELLGVGL